MLLEFEAQTPSRAPRPELAALNATRGLGWYVPLRAAADFLLSAVMLVVSAPVILLAAALVRLTSRGPAFFTQVRLGQGGRPYRIYKIRSMYHDCERVSGPRWSFGRDTRITPVGRVLRLTHVDELPQLWNVLRGEMSLIGPRPERPEFVPELARALPGYWQRLTVRPGVTGLAQVQLPPDADLTSVRRKLAHDLYYIQQLSPWLDLRLLACTAFYALGIPFALLSRFLGIPGGEEVEQAMHAFLGEPPARLSA